MSDFNIHILGCGSALPTKRRAPSAQVVDSRGKLYMIDCGENTQARLREARLGFSRLTHVFISHLHGDHCFGLPGLLSTLGLLGRVGDLVVHGPRGIEEFLEPFFRLFFKGMTYEVRIETVDPRERALVMEDHSTRVWSLPLKHRVPCCGYLFEEKPREAHIIREMIDFYHVPVKRIAEIKRGADFVTPEGVVVPNARLTRPADPPRRYAYCSDTAYAPAIIPWIEGVDLLYHEATFAEEDAARARETFHSTAREAAMIARDAGVKRLLIGHYSARYEDVTRLRDEARAIFPETYLSDEGMVEKL